MARLTLVPLLVLILTAPPSAAQEFPPLETVGHLGGFVNAAAVRGDLAFVCRADVLAVLNLAGGAPRQVAFLGFDDEPSSIALAGDTAFLSYGDQLEVVDVAVPSLPSGVATAQPFAGRFISGLATAGTFVYLALGDGGLGVVDAADPATPAAVAELALSARAVFASATAVYAVTVDGFLVVLDAGDPANPVERGRTPVPAGSRALFVDGGRAYVGGANNRGLSLVDVTDTGTPVVAGTFADGAATFDRLFADGDTAYLLGRDGTLSVVDVEQPAAPALLGAVTLPGIGGALSLDVVGGTAFATVSGRFHAVDVADPTLPKLLHPSAAPEELSDVSLAGERLYVASPDTLWRYDAGDPSAPALLGTLAAPGGEPLYRVAAAGDLLYAVDQAGRLDVVDFTDPASPVALGSYRAAAVPQEMAAAGTTIVLLLITGELEVIDAADPAAPRRVGTLALSGFGRTLLFDAGRQRVYASTGGSSSTVSIVDLADPAAPALLGSLAIEGDAIALASAGDLVFVAANRVGGTWELTAVDVSDPSQPRAGATLASPGEAWSLAALGDGTLIAGVPFGSLHAFRHDAGSFARGPVHELPESRTIAVAENDGETLIASISGFAVPSIRYVFGSKGGYLTRIPTGEGILAVLTLGAAPRPDLRCPPQPTERVAVAALQTCADEADGWLVSAITLHGFGTGDEAADLASVELDVAGRTITGAYSGDDGDVTFSLGEVVGAGECLPMTLLYRFAFPTPPCSFDPVKTYGVSVGVADVAAVPLSVPVSEKVPPEPFFVDSLVLGCALNRGAVTTSAAAVKVEDPCVITPTGLACPLIQDAVDHDETEDGDTIDVCPGLYREAVRVHKSLVVRSTDGAEVTFVEPPDGAVTTLASGRKDGKPNVYTIEKPDSAVFGQTLRGGGHGVVVANVSRVAVGGILPNQPNVVVDNEGDGVRVAGAAAADVAVESNRIGTDGDSRRANGGDGVAVEGASRVTIHGNQISANGGVGVAVRGDAARDNVVVDNVVGLSRSGAALGNLRGGVLIDGATQTTVGGEDENDGNVIGFNGDPASTDPDAGAGVTVLAGTGNRILRNVLFANRGLGIDLSRDGVRADGVNEADEGDGDSGANELQNAPVLGGVGLPDGATDFFGSLTGSPDTLYRLDFYSSPQCDPSGFGEGRVHLGTFFGDPFTRSGADGRLDFDVRLAIDVGEERLTATATDPAGNTSEFSNCAVPLAVKVVAVVHPAGLLDPSDVYPGELIAYKVLIGAAQELPPLAEPLRVDLDVPDHLEVLEDPRSPDGPVAVDGRRVRWTIPALPGRRPAELDLLTFFDCKVLELDRDAFPARILLAGNAVFASLDFPFLHSLEARQPDLVITGVEVNQAAQNLANDLPLASAKKTMIRTFIQARYPDGRVGAHCDVPRVGGQVRTVFLGDRGLTTEGKFEPPIAALVQPTDDRPSGKERGEPPEIFEVSASQHAAVIPYFENETRIGEADDFDVWEVEVEVNSDCERPDAACGEDENSRTVRVSVIETRPLDLHMRGLGFMNNAGQVVTLAEDAEELAGRLRRDAGRILPTAGARDTAFHELALPAVLAGEDLCQKPASSSVLLAVLLAAEQDRRDGTLPDDAHVYGITFKKCSTASSASLQVVGMNRGLVAIGEGEISTVLHELGHQFGLEHIRSFNAEARCREAKPPHEDESDHFPDGRFSGTHEPFELETYYGNDFGRVIPPGSEPEDLVFDVMAYCPRTWVSRLTWSHVLARTFVRQKRDGQRVLTATETLLIGAVVNLTAGTAFFSPFYHDPTPGTVAPAPAGEFELRLLAGSTLLAAHPVVVEPVSTEAGGDLLAPLAAIVPYAAGVTRIELRQDDALLAARDVSAHAPTLDLEPPAIDGDTARFDWQAGDEDGDELAFMVHFSADDGATWTTLGIDLATRRFALDLAALPGTDRARFRIRATDGVLTATATSEPFHVPSKGPRVRIDAPADGARLAAGDFLVLRGGAFDPEDGFLSGDALAWTDGVGAEVGRGDSTVVVGLAPGEHLFTLTATDGDGETAAATVRVTVVSAVELFGVVRLAAERFVTSTGAPAARIEVRRDGPATTAASVLFRTVGAEARAGEHFMDVETPLEWGAADLSPRFVDVPLLPAARDLAGEAVLLVQLTAASGAVLGTPSLATVVLTPGGTPPPPAADVPTLSPWGWGLLALLLAAAALRASRRLTPERKR
ncbi:MAG TPA: IPTL-CTERM sorting domain-containing protein [Thermoanaerobaculia bacterium]